MAQKFAAQWIRQAVDRYERPLLSYATRLLTDRDRAMDVVQDTFLRLCDQSQASREQIDQHLPEWLYTVCRNRAVDVLRRETRMTPLGDHARHFRDTQAAWPGAELAQQETTDRVLAAVDALPGNQQECIRLRFQGGLSYKEIARVTGLTVSYVGWLIHTGLKQVRQSLGEGESRTNRDARA